MLLTKENLPELVLQLFFALATRVNGQITRFPSGM